MKPKKILFIGLLIQILYISTMHTMSCIDNIGTILSTDLNTDGYLKVALNSDGNIIAIGENTFDHDRGQVRTFLYDGNAWNPMGTILGENTSDAIGFSIALNGPGNILAVGEYLFDSDRGRVRTFLYDGSSWIPMGTIIGENTGDNTGFSIALNEAGTILAVGENFFNNDIGRVRIFSYSGSSWDLIQTLNGSSNEIFFGISVALDSSGKIIAISTNQNSTQGNSAVKIYADNGGSEWDNIGTITDINSSFANALPIVLNEDGTILAIGENNFDSDRGRVRIFSYDGNAWNLVSVITGENPGDRAGISVALSSNGAILAEGEDGYLSGDFTGRVRIFNDPCLIVNSQEESFLTFLPNSYAQPTKPGSYYEKTAIDRYLRSLTK